MLRVLVVICSLCAAVCLAAPKKKAPPPKKKPTHAQVLEDTLKRLLDGAQADVGGCVVNGVEGDAPTWKQVAKVKVVLDGKGQIIEASATLVPANANAPKTKSCIEAVLRKVTWPVTHTPLTTAEREWTFAMQ